MNRRTLSVVIGLIGAKVVTHLWLVEKYGYHRDELYFIACGQHLAFGYVDHAPFVPWVARLAAFFDHSLIALRLPSILAGAMAVLGTVLLVRQWKGGTAAQLLAGLAVLSAPAFMRMSKILCIPVFEPIFWIAQAWLVTRLIERRDRRLWLAIGAVAGFGLLVKHTMLLWGFGLAVSTIFIRQLRSDLRSPWPWLGSAIALVVFAPNVVWQVQNGWATLEFLNAIRRGMLDEIPRALFLAGQFLYMNPFAAPVWIIGLAFLLRDPRPSRRVHGVVFLAVVGALLVLKGKPYYLAPTFPALHAAGGIWLESYFQRRAWRHAPTFVSGFLGAACVAASLVTLPIFPLRSIDIAAQKLFGWIVPPIALTHDLHDEFGWPEQARSVARVVNTLSADERERAVILTGNYGEASAANFFGKNELPPAVTGHMTYYLWGPTSRPADVAVSYGIPEAKLRKFYGDVRVGGQIEHPLAHPKETKLPIYVCRAPRRRLADAWPEFKRYWHE